MDSHSKQCSCGGPCLASSVHQTLDEMDFERGIWSAALDGDLERVRLLLKKGTDPDIRDQTGYTALHYASRAGHLSACELLLAQGASSNSRTHGGATALHRAAFRGHLTVAQLLLQYGADPSITDDDGSTPLHKAAEQGHLEVCELILNSCPALRTQMDKRLRLPVDVSPDNSAMLGLLKPPQ